MSNFSQNEEKKQLQVNVVPLPGQLLLEIDCKPTNRWPC